MKVNVYIDGANFYWSCRNNLPTTKIDLGAFADALVGGERALGRTYYYTAPAQGDARDGQQRFLRKLARIPYLEVRLGRLVERTIRCRSCGNEHVGYQEKGVDMRIGVDMLSHGALGLYDVAILVSGDGDFEHAVQAVKNQGKHVEVACFSSNRSDALLTASDYMHELTPEFFADLYINLGTDGLDPG